eukprot:10712027-Alexandrium_andersonii.AAC.1
MGHSTCMQSESTSTATRHDTSRKARLVCAVIPDNLIIPNVTLPQVYARIRWSFEHLARGRWPERDYLGNPFNRHHFRGVHANESLMGGCVGVLDG